MTEQFSLLYFVSVRFSFMPKQAKLIWPKFRVVLFTLFVALLTLGGWAQTTDHGGSDFTPSDGLELTGSHLNIRLFTVAAGTTIPCRGAVRVEAQSVAVNGVLDATGQGYSGGDHEQLQGDGPYGGIISPYAYDNINGGYMDFSRNGDATTDTAVAMGSGGGAIVYWWQLYQPGLSGGGSIELVSSGAITIGPEGAVLADGAPRTFSGRNSNEHGAGAGGGILLHAVNGSTVTLAPASRLSNLGSDGSGNGGSVKVIGGGNGNSIESAALIATGRLFTTASSPPKVDVAIEEYWATTNRKCNDRRCLFWDYITVANYGSETVKKCELAIYALDSPESSATGKPLRRFRFKFPAKTVRSTVVFTRVPSEDRGKYFVAVLRTVGVKDENSLNDRGTVGVIP